MPAYQGLASFTLIAILLGILIRNTAGVPQLFNPGVAFVVDKLLKLGIIPYWGKVQLLQLADHRRLVHSHYR